MGALVSSLGRPLIILRSGLGKRPEEVHSLFHEMTLHPSNLERIQAFATHFASLFPAPASDVSPIYFIGHAYADAQAREEVCATRSATARPLPKTELGPSRPRRADWRYFASVTRMGDSARAWTGRRTLNAWATLSRRR